MNKIIEKLTEELNSQQKKAVENPLFSCTKIVAGAGTGKTKIISKRFAKLIYDLIDFKIENPASHLLVITFTDKAANEMKRRIIKEINENKLSCNNDELWVSTFHGFCSKFLRRHSIEVNLSPDFKLAEEVELYKTYESIVNTLKYNEYKTISNIEKICGELGLSIELLDVSNLKKISAISSLDNIFSDIFNIIKKIKSLGLSPKEFLQKTVLATQTFSEKLSLLPFSGSTLEEYMMNWQNHLKPYIDDFCVFEEGIFKNLTKTSVLLSKNGQRKAEKWTCADDFHQNIVKNETLELYLTKLIAIIYAIYQNQLEMDNIVDFDDLINKTIYILKNNIVIRTYYQKYFKHLIIDEFQDTNGSQLELIKLLLNEEQPNITFVGDRKQSIYGFRFAQMENLEVLHKFIEEKYNEKYPEIKLETNYRSTSHVLNAVNYITEEHLQLDEALNPFEKNIINEENKHIKNVEITDFEFASAMKEVEAKYIASEIQRLKKEENASYKEIAILVKSHAQADFIEKFLTKYSIPSIKKTNKSFFTHNVIKNAKAALQLIKNPLDEIALTRILKIYLSDKELYEFKKKINEYYEPIKSKEEKRPNLCEKILKIFEENVIENLDVINVFDTINNVLRNKKNNSILQLFITFSQKIQLFVKQNGIEDFQSRINLKIFEKIIFDYEQSRPYASVYDFLEYFEKIEEDKNFELPNVFSTNIDAVQIMTIHSSKGLEFPYTFVCAISSTLRKNDGHLILDLQYGKKCGFGLIVTKVDEKESPKNLVYKELWQKPRDLSEAIRLFYVAASRAEKYLNILTFEEKGKTKPAFYTKDFPSFVIKEQISLDKIALEKNEKFQILPQEVVDFLPQISKQIDLENEKVYNFSFSKLNTFNSCPSKFLFKYKYGFPVLSVQNQAAQIGSIVHKIIYNTVVYNQILSDEKLNKLLKEFNIEENAKNNIITSYKNFLISQYSPLNLANKEFIAEHNFNFVYKLGDNEINFIGDIDLLVKNNDNTYTIVDFKTNANIEAEKENYYNQLYLYKIALESQGLKIKSSEILSLNNDGKLLSIYLENEEKVKAGFDKLLQMAVNCYEKELFEGKQCENKKCSICEYNYICS